jgi:hypothetical protein
MTAPKIVEVKAVANQFPRQPGYRIEQGRGNPRL